MGQTKNPNLIRKYFTSEQSAKGFADRVKGTLKICSEAEQRSGGSKYKVIYNKLNWVPPTNTRQWEPEQPQFRPTGDQWDDYAWTANDF